MSALGAPGKALVVGLGRSGRAAAALLARRGWVVTAVDAGAAEGAEDELAPLGVEVLVGHAGAIPGVDLVVKSPGVPGADPAVVAARAGGAPVWSEIELAARELPNPVLAITGTNGKTTTTELAAHLLRSAGRAAVACGNVGTPVAGLVDRVDPGAWLVMECSSFQLEDIDRFRPSGAVLLNLSADHMDRHGSMEAYRDAKLRIFERQGPGDLAILPAPLVPPGAAPARRLAEHAGGPEVVAWSEGGLHVARLGWIIDWEQVPLRGRHNRENVMAAAALAAHAGLSGPEIAAGLRGFAPVAHRLEPVGERGGVVFVNDSKATNPDAVMAALDAYPERVRLIAGGRDKGTPFGPLARAAAGAVVHAYLMGEAGPALAREFAAAGVAHSVLPTMADALAAAAAAARPGDTVLLGPACTSFDQYASYVERGDAFRAMVAGLPPA